jgi:nicotinate-nucleotide--dimethylbenzimidazole phosphoribosyltransferase
VTLGWLCLGWPDERPPAPGLERAGWSRRQPLSDVLLFERWGEDTGRAPVSHLRAPEPDRVVAVRDGADRLLSPTGSLGLLDRCVDRVQAASGHQAQGPEPLSGALLLVAGRHPVTALGISAFAPSVTDDVLAASRAGESAGAVAARANGLAFEVVDAGSSTGDLAASDALSADEVSDLIDRGRALGERAGRAHGVLALGEVGIGNTTVAAALTSALLGLPPRASVGLGAGADSEMLERKRQVVEQALGRAGTAYGAGLAKPLVALAAVGGPEFCVLAGAVLGAASVGAVVVLDGLATSVAAVAAVALEPGSAAYLVAGQRSREVAHAAVLQHLGLEPLLDLRLRAGEGVGAALAVGMLLSAVQVRRGMGRTQP